MARVIAIDGPSGAGKSSVSRLVGERLGFLHVDSGALYRIMTWQCLENGVDTSLSDAVAAFAEKVKIEMPDETSKRHGQAVIAATLPPDELIKG